MSGFPQTGWELVFKWHRLCAAPAHVTNDQERLRISTAQSPSLLARHFIRYIYTFGNIFLLKDLKK